MSARYLVVDGHSVIFSWPELRALHGRNRAAARQALATQLQHLHDTTPWRVTLILDGKLGSAVSTGSSRRTAGMVISYATANQTADSIIERLVAASGRAREILVITADEAEKTTVEALGAATASPTWLRETLDREGEAFNAEMARVHHSARWKR
ncbi:MAG TPA: NYN domain-containing protein [Candidatus Methylacidiphilales bacterium]|nr:NYN domain-containing protein [Candidatus Methylacidiphilales bacterium]